MKEKRSKKTRSLQHTQEHQRAYWFTGHKQERFFNYTRQDSPLQENPEITKYEKRNAIKSQKNGTAVWPDNIHVKT